MMSSLSGDLVTGFNQPVFDASAVFRAVLDVMAWPGRIVGCPTLPQAPASLGATAFAVVMTLCDSDTPIWLSPACDTKEARSNIAFHTGAAVIDAPEKAAFAVLDGGEAARTLPRLAVGTPEYPDRSATAIILVRELTARGGALLSGPGVDGTANLSVGDQDPMLWQARIDACRHFPLGIEMILAGSGHLAAIPRSTKTEI